MHGSSSEGGFGLVGLLPWIPLDPRINFASRLKKLPSVDSPAASGRSCIGDSTCSFSGWPLTQLAAPDVVLCICPSTHGVKFKLPVRSEYSCQPAIAT